MRRAAVSPERAYAWERTRVLVVEGAEHLEGGAFPKGPGDDVEFVPLPESCPVQGEACWSADSSAS
jgi:hypothetical protein